MSLELVWDMDGVLVNFHDKFAEMANKMAGKNIRPMSNEASVLNFNFAEDFGDEIVSRIFNSLDVWVEAELDNDYYAIYKKYEDKSIICSSHANAISMLGKSYWLKKHGFDEKRIVYAKNKNLLSRPNRLLIDDQPNNCASFAKGQYGGGFLFVRRPWSLSASFSPKDISISLASHVTSPAQLAAKLKELM